jgi:phage shock protein B
MPGFIELIIILVILCVFAIPIVLVLGALRILTKSGGRGKEMGMEEAKMMQDLHQGLARMGQRIEALETILLERESQKKA